MPRYFFNLRDGHDLGEDDEGVELSDSEAARAEAMATVEELREELSGDHATSNLKLEVADFFRGYRGQRR